MLESKVSKLLLAIDMNNNCVHLYNVVNEISSLHAWATYTLIMQFIISKSGTLMERCKHIPPT